MYTEAFDLDRLEMGEGDYRGSVAYARAKRAQVVLVDALARREPAGGLELHAVHPGWAATPGVTSSLPTFDRLMGPLLRSPEEGIDCLVWLAAAEEGSPPPGQLWLDRQPRPLHRLGRTKVDAATQAADGEALVDWLDSRLGLRS
jgi:NAD(P)-dependent dehydrogenase (short-subunit alcohol dehydrogenase family)